MHRPCVVISTLDTILIYTLLYTFDSGNGLPLTEGLTLSPRSSQINDPVCQKLCLRVFFRLSIFGQQKR